jgi:hypothetical protein
LRFGLVCCEYSLWYLSSTTSDFAATDCCFVNRRTSLHHRSLTRPAQAAAALVAIAGAGLVQVGWADVLDPRSSAGRPSAAALLVLASFYLVASAWFNVQGALRTGGTGEPWWPRRLGLFCDGMLSGTVLAIMTRGHQSGVLSLGLWSVPPVLFAFSSISGTITLLSWHKSARDQARSQLTATSGRGFGLWAVYLRILAAVLLLAILIAVEIGGRARATFR